MQWILSKYIYYKYYNIVLISVKLNFNRRIPEVKKTPAELAEEKKAQANLFYKSGSYRMAEDLYTQAISKNF